MSPRQLFYTIGEQLGEVITSAKEAEKSGYGIEELVLETQFEVDSKLKQTELPNRQSYLNSHNDNPLFKVKITVY